MLVHPYLTFNGNCREAMSFYQKCLGGELFIQTVEESPLAGDMPLEMKKAILSAVLKKGQTILMGTDMTDEKGLTKGNSVSILLRCNSEKEIKMIYQKLSEGGLQNQPLETTFAGGLTGDILDKYGNNWVLYYSF